MQHHEKYGSTVAVDFETFYDKKAGYSVSSMTPHIYVNDPRFDPYLVSVVGETGEEYVGSPFEFDWKLLTGARLVMHNASFDGIIINRLIELGRIPEFERELIDTADMCAFMCAPRSLAGACKALLGMDVSKAVRTAMDGRKFESLNQFEREALLQYAADDSRLCLQLFRTYGDKWPQWERDVSRLNREATWRGIRIDVKAAREGLAKLEAKKEASAAALPWSEEDAKAGSRKQFLAYVKDLGLPVPNSVAKNDPGFMAWADRYKDQYPFIQARLDYASLGSHISRLHAMIARADSEDVLRYESKYFGSHTGRCSGSARNEGDENTSGKANLYNIPKGDKHGRTHGVDLRGLHIPRPGHCYMIYDYGQIEARVVHWIAGDTEFLSKAAKENIYQVTAKTLGWYPQDSHSLKDDDAKLYLLSKGTELGSGFGMGGAKFSATCERNGVELPAVPKDKWVLDRRMKFMLRNIARLDWGNPENEAKISAVMSGDAVIQAWRRSNPKIPLLWRSLEDALRGAAERNAPVHYFTLPSGRRKPYWKPHLSLRPKIVYDAETGQPEQKVESKLSAYLVLGDKIPEVLHGGPLTENLVQATARDIMFHGALGVQKEAPQWFYMFNIYDELVFEVPLCDVEAAQKVIPELLVSGPMLAWARGLPLEVEGGPADKYTKHDPRWRKHSGMVG